jgi:phage terminase Nu1 subunit (DNA packaging protein)
MPTIVDSTQLAQIFNTTRQHIARLVRAGMPVVSRGVGGRGNRHKIDLEAAVRWYFSENFERLEFTRQRTRLAQEQADKIAFENRRAAEKLGDLQIVHRYARDHLARARTRIAQLPNEIGARVDPSAASVARSVAGELVASACLELEPADNAQ